MSNNKPWCDPNAPVWCETLSYQYPTFGGDMITIEKSKEIEASIIELLYGLTIAEAEQTLIVVQMKINKLATIKKPIVQSPDETGKV